MNPLKTIIRSFINSINTTLCPSTPFLEFELMIIYVRRITLSYLVIMSRLHAAYGQVGHWYGFSPVWVRWWVDRWSDREKTWKRNYIFIWKIFNIVFCALTFYFSLGYNSDRRLNDYLVVNDLGQKPCLNYGLHIKVTSNCFVIFEQNCIQNYDS